MKKVFCTVLFAVVLGSLLTADNKKVIRLTASSEYELKDALKPIELGHLAKAVQIGYKPESSEGPLIEIDDHVREALAVGVLKNLDSIEDGNYLRQGYDEYTLKDLGPVLEKMKKSGVVIEHNEKEVGMENLYYKNCRIILRLVDIFLDGKRAIAREYYSRQLLDKEIDTLKEALISRIISEKCDENLTRELLKAYVEKMTILIQSY